MLKKPPAEAQCERPPVEANSGSRRYKWTLEGNIEALIHKHFLCLKRKQ